MEEFVSNEREKKHNETEKIIHPDKELKSNTIVMLATRERIDEQNDNLNKELEDTKKKRISQR